MAEPAIAHAPAAARDRLPLRFVTAASLFDGHDASINIMRRMLQSAGAEVIHLGHNRSVEEIVTATVQEDAHAVAVSSYQGGHVEFFKYLVDQLRERDSAHIRVFGGGGGVIVADEIRELHDYGVSRIYSPADGQQLGLGGLIEDMLGRAGAVAPAGLSDDVLDLLEGTRGGGAAPTSASSASPEWVALARLISAIERGSLTREQRDRLKPRLRAAPRVPILGVTGTGGAGKSSLTDELVRRLRYDYDDRLKIAVLAVDPSRRKSGGALLGDRIRMNAIDHRNIYVRSLATRGSGAEVPAALEEILRATRLGGFDLIVVETSGIGQGDADIVPLVDLPLYVMTPEFGAASQLEKIDMLDFAAAVAINKFDRRGAADAYRDVAKQLQRNREAFDQPLERMPVFGTIAAQFNDDGVTALYQEVIRQLRESKLGAWPPGRLPAARVKTSTRASVLVPSQRTRYLAEVSQTIRAYHARVEDQAQLARERQQLLATRRMLGEGASSTGEIDRQVAAREHALEAGSLALLEEWPALRNRYQADELVVTVRDREVRTALTHTTLSGSRIPKIALPRYNDAGDLLRWRRRENLPGHFPYTAGVFAFKREGEDPSRMFAGEGDAFRTNRRFKYLSEHSSAKRLSTAFDSVTLYGFDPARRPDIYGKVGNSGVSIATLDDMRALYDGFDLCDPSTSVSMTINGPAPTILAMFLNTAIDQQIVRFGAEHGRPPDDAEQSQVRAFALANVRGTVQADILKEDQGQNTCIFSTEFSLKMMGDIQAYFVDERIRNFYSVSISGYHIAEAGANPISQLAFTLANGFTYVEAYLARGMPVDDFAPNLSFFFSNGMDPEYTVMGRVARRIWAVAMRERYGANERSQKLKYHIQTSGRSLHAQEMSFNDIRTTLQALIATYDHCNSLHTNAYDEAVTTPTEDSVRRALAIQLVINKEWGLARNENPNQGAFIIEELTDLVEEAVLQEFERISERGGVLGAMETGYQRGKIQDESLDYESRKHDGTLPIVGVNTFLNPLAGAVEPAVELARSTREEKESQLERLADFQQRHRESSAASLIRLQEAALRDENVFAELMPAVRTCSLGQITDALFEVGGKYRRSM